MDLLSLIGIGVLSEQVPHNLHRVRTRYLRPNDVAPFAHLPVPLRDLVALGVETVSYFGDVSEQLRVASGARHVLATHNGFQQRVPRLLQAKCATGVGSGSALETRSGLKAPGV